MKKEESQFSSNRRDFVKTVATGSTAGFLGLSGLAQEQVSDKSYSEKSFTDPVRGQIKITDLKCAVIGDSPVVRITTDAGISGYGQVESFKPYLKPHILFYKDYLIGEDPTNVARIMLKIRRMGGFKPWGSSVSAIEMALWDIAGKAAGVPVYKLLGGKIRDRVRVYLNSGIKARPNIEEYIAWGENIKKSKEGFTIVKTPVGFHGGYGSVPNFSYRTTNPAAINKDRKNTYLLHGQGSKSAITEYGLKYILERVAAMKEGLGDGIGLALDIGPGMVLPDAIRLAKLLEPYNLIWAEDMLVGDYHPFVGADEYRELTRSTTTPIHTGEQIYLRENCRDLIEKHAVRVLGPDPADIGGIAELKWVAEYADLHGIQIAAHGVLNGLIGLAAQVQVGAAMPENYIAFEYKPVSPAWWYDIVEGLPDPIVKEGLIDVWDRPGLGVEFNVKAARKYLSEEDKDFFD